MKFPKLRKSYVHPDHESIVKSLKVLRDDPRFKLFVEFRESQREEVIRQMQDLHAVSDTNLHFHLSGKLAAIDEELDVFASLAD